MAKSGIYPYAGHYLSLTLLFPAEKVSLLGVHPIYRIFN